MARRAGLLRDGADEQRGSEPLNYVYDCGACSIPHLESLVAAYARRVSHIDALFVLHLDGDHVGGLDTLTCTLG